jgi:hypothetical protein
VKEQSWSGRGLHNQYLRNNQDKMRSVASRHDEGAARTAQVVACFVKFAIEATRDIRIMSGQLVRRVALEAAALFPSADQRGAWRL